MRVTRALGGYSLYELIITTLAVGTLISLGVPTFGGLLADTRLRAEVDALFHAVYLARKESVFRRREVVLCPSPDGEACVQATDWSGGWLMFVNLDRDAPAAVDAGEPVLQRHRGGAHSTIVANRQYFAFRSTELRATNGTFVFCDVAGRTEPRALVVSYTGRPRVARSDRDGNPYACGE